MWVVDELCSPLGAKWYHLAATFQSLPMAPLGCPFSKRRPSAVKDSACPRAADASKCALAFSA